MLLKYRATASPALVQLKYIEIILQFSGIRMQFFTREITIFLHRLVRKYEFQTINVTSCLLEEGWQFAT